MAQYASLTPGDPAPWFKQRSFSNPNYNFDVAAGRYVVLCFFASAADPHAQAAMRAMREREGFFDDKQGCFFGVSVDSRDESEKRAADHYPGHRLIWDFDCKVSRLYGAIPKDVAGAIDANLLRRFWVVLDPTLRIIAVVPFARDRSDVDQVAQLIETLPPPGHTAGFEVQAPILVLPNVFEPELCRDLIGRYEEHGGMESGFMREVDGKTVTAHDYGHKRRRDYVIADPNVISATQDRFVRRVTPMIQRAHQFKVTRMERYIVSCYSAEDGGHFRPHRDNTTKGTAHRRFAVSVNLNDDFDGGEVSFPEYGPRSFKAPTGGAVVFSCSLLHSVSKVTRGRRFAFLPFLYDDEAAKVREMNASAIEDPALRYQGSGTEGAAEATPDAG
ncbi:MAG: 2OG-Fe(II) oxygenase [Hyphomicrobiaceae bacterium]